MAEDLPSKIADMESKKMAEDLSSKIADLESKKMAEDLPSKIADMESKKMAEDLSSKIADLESKKMAEDLPSKIADMESKKMAEDLPSKIADMESKVTQSTKKTKRKKTKGELEKPQANRTFTKEEAEELGMRERMENFVKSRGTKTKHPRILPLPESKSTYVNRGKMVVITPKSV